MNNKLHDSEVNTDTKITYGIWVYILTDFIMFACLFASFVVLRENTYGAIGIRSVSPLFYQLILTLVLLASSFLFGLSYVQSKLLNKAGTISCLFISLVMYSLFIFLLYNGLHVLFAQGYDWQTSGFLSIYYIITVMFAVHVFIAALWILVIVIQMLYAGISIRMSIRMRCLNLYCNYLTLIWILIFTIVYLMRSI